MNYLTSSIPNEMPKTGERISRVADYMEQPPLSEEDKTNYFLTSPFDYITFHGEISHKS